MKSNLKIKMAAILVLCMAWSMNLLANDTIRVVWQGSGFTITGFEIFATNGRTFNIDWGDGSAPQSVTGTGLSQYLFPSAPYGNTNQYTVTISAASSNCFFTRFHCFSRQVTSLDVSNCPQLTYLDCSSNQLNFLNVSNNTQLTSLYCGNNQLSSLDVSNNTQLTGLGCDYNQLTSLNVSNNTQLTYLRCYNNQLSSLDVSSNTQLIRLECSSNQLSSLDVSNCPQLTYLTCSSNQLSSLDVSSNTLLTELYCQYNQLSSLNVSSNTQLIALNCPYNQLSSLDVSNNTQLTYFGCEYNHFPLSELFIVSEALSNNGVTGYLGTQTLSPQVIAPSVELQFPVAQDVFNGIYTDFTVTKNGSLAPPSSYSVSSGRITFNTPDIYTVMMTNQAIHSPSYEPAQVTFTVMVTTTTTPTIFHSDDKEGLRTFLRQPSAIAGKTNAEQLGLTVSDTLSWQTDEAWVLKVADYWNDETPKRLLQTGSSWTSWSDKNLAGTLNANKWAKLERLTCSYNPSLSSLNVSGNPQLTYLDCYNNQLSTLNVSNNPYLTYLTCSYNQLSSLDLSSNPQLTILYCWNNQLSSLDLSGNPQLTELHCQHNQLSSLNVSNNTNLTLLDCRYNQLSALNVNSNTQLGELTCWNNQLSSLDVSHNTQLTHLDCDQNQISSLDVSHNTLLATLWCRENKLSTLDISTNTQLSTLGCYDNHLQLSDLYAASQQISNVNEKYLGTQRLPIQATMADMAIDFSAQAEFGGVATAFFVRKGSGVPATVDVDYTINNGIITFLNTGNYTVRMTNSAIQSNSQYPAIVIAEIFISGVNIPENTLKGVEVYPNPATTQLYVKLAEPQTAAYSICNLMGQVVKQGTLQGDDVINVTSLVQGTYFLKVAGGTVKFVKM